ncbi:MAG: RNA-binding protein [Gammaproteobacteria bacterium]|nr:RNA-binding protein [Gammaproteobacteria bacterium]
MSCGNIGTLHRGASIKTLCIPHTRSHDMTPWHSTDAADRDHDASHGEILELPEDYYLG